MLIIDRIISLTSSFNTCSSNIFSICYIQHFWYYWFQAKNAALAVYYTPTNSRSITVGKHHLYISKTLLISSASLAVIAHMCRGTQIMCRYDKSFVSYHQIIYTENFSLINMAHDLYTYRDIMQSVIPCRKCHLIMKVKKTRQCLCTRQQLWWTNNAT